MSAWAAFWPSSLDGPSLRGPHLPACRWSAFTGLGASSIDFQVMVWCKSEDWIAVQSDVRDACYNALNERKIDIPFNQLVVHQAS